MIRTANIAHAVTATTPLLARVATQAGLTVAKYLRSHGVHPQWIAQWGGAFGTKAKAAFRAANDGAQPRTIREGRYDVAAYDTTQYLDVAMAHYRKHKKAGPQLTAGYDRAKAAAKQPRDARGRFARLYVVTWTTPAGRQIRRNLTADQAAALVRTLVRHHRADDVAARDSAGRRADFALAA